MQKSTSIIILRAISENNVVHIINTGIEQIAIREGQVAHHMPNAESISFVGK